MKRPGILKLWLAVALNALAITASAAVKVYRATDFGIRPGTGKSLSALMQKAVEVKDGDTPEVLQKRVMEQAEWIILPEAVEKLCASL